MGGRTLQTTVLALVGLALFGLLRPDSPDPVDDVIVAETAFFLEKAQGDDRSDCVIIGDSRALRGFSPLEIRRSLPGWTVRNLAFNSGGLNEEMYAFAERRLVEDGPRRTVVVALTPLTLQPWKTNNEQYREYLAKSADAVILHRDLRGVADFFEPVQPAVPVKIVLGVEPPIRLVQTYHDDGWIESRHEPPTSVSEVDDLRERLTGNVADPELFDRLLEQVAAWSAEGIRVVGVRPPSSTAVESVENRLLAFDPDDAAARFRAAGGEWITLPQDGWTLYDGTHLDAASARRASALLGEALAKPRP